MAVLRSSVVPSPTSPFTFAPQHQMSSLVRAHTAFAPLMKRAAFGAVLLAFVAACSTRSATQIVVEIDAERGVRGAVEVVHVVVNGGDGTTAGAPRVQRLDVRERPPRWPFTVVIAPLERDSERRYEIVVSAKGPAPTGGGDRPVVATVRAISGFVPDETRVLRLLLEDACRGVACDAEETCRAGTCMVATVDPSILAGPEVDAGPSVDASAATDDTTSELDAFSALDAARDAANLDAGPPLDAAITSPVLQIAGVPAPVITVS